MLATKRFAKIKSFGKNVSAIKKKKIFVKKIILAKILAKEKVFVKILAKKYVFVNLFYFRETLLANTKKVFKKQMQLKQESYKEEFLIHYLKN